MVDLSGTTWTLIVFAAILGFTALLAYVAKLVIWGLMRQVNPQVTVAAQRLGVTIVWLVGVVLAVQELGVSVDALLLVILLLGAAAIVALRQPLENYGAKYFTDVYTPFKIGDTIQVGEHTGRVIEINAMGTVLLTENDHLVSLPNSLVLQTSVINLTPHAWKEVVVPITIPSSTDLAEFENSMLKALSRMRTRLGRRYPPVFTVISRTSQSTDLVLTVMVRRPEDRDPVVAEVNLRLTETMERAPSSGSRTGPAPESAGIHP